MLRRVLYIYASILQIDCFEVIPFRAVLDHNVDFIFVQNLLARIVILLKK